MSIPSNINTDITKISNAKTLIRNAINAKGVSVSADDTFASYAQKIGQLNAPDGYKVIVVDYDGEIITQATKQAGETFTLPAGPTNHSKLVFQEWSSCDEITNNTVTIIDHDILVGAVYTTASGTNEFDIVLTEATGKDVTFRMAGNKNWGDGTTDNLTTHTYADYGEYTITCDGTTLNQSYMMGQSTNGIHTADSKLKNIRLATVTSMTNNVFYWCSDLETFTASTSLLTIGTSNFQACLRLKCCILSNHVTSNSFAGTFSNDYNLKYAIVPNNTNLNLQGTFQGCFSLCFPIFPSNCISFQSTYQQCCSLPDEIYIPAINQNCSFQTMFNTAYGIKNITINATACNHITTLASTFYQCYALEEVNFLGELSVVTTLASAFYQCYNLQSAIIPSCATLSDNATTSSMFYNCLSLRSVQLPSTITYWGNNMFPSDVVLSSIKAPSTLTNIGTTTFQTCSSIIDYDFTDCLQIPAITSSSFYYNNSAQDINKGCQIKVPRSLYQDWIRTENWSRLKKYIYGGKPATLNFSVTPSIASDIYVYDEQNHLDGTTSCSFVGTTTPYIVYNPTVNTVLVGELNNIVENSTYNITANLNGTSKTITWQTGVSNCIITVNIRGIDIVVPESNTSGTYILNIIGDSATINYTIGHQLIPEMENITGSIDYQGSNVTETVTMDTSTKKYYTPMEAITAADTTKLYIFNNVNQTGNAYKWFNGDTTDYVSISSSYLCDRYNGNVGQSGYNYGLVRKYDSPVCLNKINIYPYSTSYTSNPTKIYLSASNDGTTWTQLSSKAIKGDGTSSSYTTALPNTNPIVWDFNNLTKYSYYRFGLDYTNGEYWSVNWKEIDCPTYESTTWDTSYNRTINITHNVNYAKIVEAYITNNNGYKFPLYHWDNIIQGVFNTEGNNNVRLVIKVAGYQTYTEDIVVSSSSITRNITLAEQHINVDLNPGVTSYGWKVSSRTNPKSSDGWLMYESDMKNVDSNQAVMKITIDGDTYSNFTMYINSYAESSCDYTTCTDLDPASHTTIKSGASTQSKQYTPEVFNTTNYTTVTYSDIPSGEHFIYITFRTDGSSHQNYDAGFVLIDPDQ